MSTHVNGLRVTDLEHAWLSAKTRDHAVSLVDDTDHMNFLVDQDGRVTAWPIERQPAPEWLYRKAGS
jgi:hypothetical protein